MAPPPNDPPSDYDYAEENYEASGPHGDRGGQNDPTIFDSGQWQRQEPTPAYERAPRYPTPAQPIEVEPAHEPPAPPPPAAHSLSPQERHQLLIQAIQLYKEDWRLAGIRAKPKPDWLVAYLVPRRSRLDLGQAISKRQVLVITVDRRGNTDINEPKRRGLWGTFISWLYGG